MLTKLDKQDIKATVAEATQEPRSDVGSLKSDFSSLKKGIDSLKKEVIRGFKKVHKDQESIIGFFNREVLDIKNRVDRIESAPPIAHQLRKKS